MFKASQRYSVPIGVLYAVGLTETGRKDTLQPYALNIAGKGVFADSPATAIRYFREAQAAGTKLIDMGCMQINYHYHGNQFATPEQMLQPHQNVDYAARFLKKLYQREGNWTMAVARYHAGPNNDSAQKKYVCRVLTNMVATGFGQWTANARKFCFL